MGYVTYIYLLYSCVLLVLHSASLSLSLSLSLGHAYALYSNAIPTGACPLIPDC